MLEKMLNVVMILLYIFMVTPTTEKESESAVKTLHYSECLTPVGEYPHNPESFTQGLFFYNGEMYESTGQYEKSKLYKNIDIESGIAKKEHFFADDIFAEGSVVFADKLYVLTYKENQVQVFDPETLVHEMTYSYPRQGWGLTTNGKFLIASDGTSNLYFMDEELNVIKSVAVTNDGIEMLNINELEYIDGEIWANQWLSERILVIDPESGNVKRIIDFQGLYQPAGNDPDDVLNGIAYNPQNGSVYVTGKRWDKLFEFKINADV